MSHFSWQTGGRVASAHHDQDSAASGEPKVALILGVTGTVGNYLAELLSKPDTPGGPWKVYGVARRPRPEWIPASAENAQVNLLDRDATMSKIGALKDVTHVFFVTWAQEKNEKENIELNTRLLQNALDAVLANARNLQHIVLQTGTKHCTGLFELMGKIKPHEAPFVEDVPRLPCDNFYYHQEDLLFDTAKRSGGRFTYSIHRPTLIMGFAAGNLMNIVGTVAVSALICKHEGNPSHSRGTSSRTSACSTSRTPSSSPSKRSGRRWSRPPTTKRSTRPCDPIAGRNLRHRASENSTVCTRSFPADDRPRRSRMYLYIASCQSFCNGPGCRQSDVDTR